MPWRGPAFDGDFPSLGHRLLAWYATYLRIPNGPRFGQPLELTAEQAAFVIRFYGLTAAGERFYRRGALRRAKGWGKSPMLAAMAVGELCGPVEFAGWDATGEPVGRPKPTPWVQVAACSEDQTDNTYAPLVAMLGSSPAVDDFGLDVGITRTYMRGSPGRIEPVTSAAGSREGQPVTFAVLDETHLWVRSNHGHKLAETIRRNVAKMNGQTVETTNAYIPGVDSVAEQTDKAAAKAQKGLLYDAVEGPWVEDLADTAQLLAALRVAYGAATWVDLPRLVEEAQDPAINPGEYRRFFLNQIIAPELDVIDARDWAALQRDTALKPGDTIAIGFDGSVTGDATALYACRWPEWTVFRLGVWERPAGVKDYRVPVHDVDATVEQTMRRYRVVRGYADPPYWRKEIAEWQLAYGDKKILEYPTSSDLRITRATDRWDAMCRSGALGHDGDPILAAHIAHAMRGDARGEQEGSWRPVKKGTGHIDAFVAAVLAVHALGDAVAAGEVTETPAPFMAAAFR